LGISFAVLAIFILVLLTFTLYSNIRGYIRNSMRERLHDAVSIAALQIDADTHSTLVDPTHEGNDAYMRIKYTLQQIHDSVNNIHFIYTMRQNSKGQIIFVVDAEANPENMAHLGEVYHTASPMLTENFATIDHPIVEEDFYTDKWGTWLTGYAPFFDSEGQRKGVLGIDISVDKVLAREQQFFWIFLIIFCSAIPFILIMGWLVGRWLAAPISLLTFKAGQIAEGDFSARMLTSNIVEIGKLSHAFNKMTTNLKKSREELEEYSKNLEKKVEEKTRDLEIDISKRKKTEGNLRAEKEFTDTLIDTAQAIVLVLDKEGRVIRFNHFMEKISGYKLEEVKGNSWFDTFLPERNRIQTKKLFLKAIDDIQTKGSINTIMTKDGHEVVIEWHDKTLRNEKGKTIGLMAVGLDITEQKKLQQALRENEERLSFALKATNDGVWDRSLKSGKLYLNDNYYKILGYNPGEIAIAQKGFEEFLHPEDKKWVLQKIQECIDGKTKDYNAEFRMKTKSGNWKWILCRGNVVSRDSNGKPLRFLGTHVDISRRKEAEEKLEKLARIDSLTNCYSRGYGLELFDRQIKLSNRSKSPLLLAFLDIDEFKLINDNFGHDEGNKALKESVELFKSTLRDIDIICRMGGDEFLLIFPDNSLKEASLIRSRLQKNLSQLNKKIKKDYQIKFSMGFSEYLPDKPETLDKLIAIADQRMYEEKKKDKRVGSGLAI